MATKHLTIASLLIATVATGASAQTALDAYSLAQHELRGTARFMSMGGAFTALGGDLSTLNQNPGGIGVYRSSEISATLDINAQSVRSLTLNAAVDRSQTKVNCNNFGYIGAVYTGSDIMPYFNWGASYSRIGSFDRAYRGNIPQLNGSLSNYIAGYTTAEGWASSQLTGNDKFNPYMDDQAPWMSILGYNGYLINPVGATGQYNGLWQDGTTGYGSFDVVEKGYVDEYAINFGGNISNIVYWGIGFGITDIDFNSSVYYTEDMDNARIPADADGSHTVTGAGGFGLDSWKHINGTGFNFKTGVIIRPINELRFGLAVHTPTYYNLKQEGWAQIDYGYGGGLSGLTETNEGYTDYFEWKLRTPWRLMAGVAGIIGSKGILSLDYEYRPMQKMSIRDNQGYEYTDMNADVATYYKAVNILRIGAEYRLTPQWSVRAGYSIQSSPTTTEVQNSQTMVYTSGPDDTETTPSYSLDKTTNYISCGLGYRYKNIYVDAAYVHRHRESTFHPFTANRYTATPVSSKLTDNQNQIVLTAGVKF